MLMKGEAGPPDPKRALPLYQLAAAGNHPVAQFQLAQWYETGWEGMVPQNTLVARRLYAATASHGMKAAEERLAVLGPEPPKESPPEAPKQAPAQPLETPAAPAEPALVPAVPPQP